MRIKILYFNSRSRKTKSSNNEKTICLNSTLLKELSEEYEAVMKPVSFYFADGYAELQELKGFDFIVGCSGEEIPSGKAYSKFGMAFGSGVGEYYPHEIIHLYFSSIYPDAHLWFDEGFATY